MVSGYLRQNLDVAAVAAKLRQYGNFSDVHVEELKVPRIEESLTNLALTSQSRFQSIQSSEEKVAKFVEILARRGPEAFELFCTALRKTNQGFIAQVSTTNQIHSCSLSQGQNQLSLPSPSVQNRRNDRMLTTLVLCRNWS